MADKECKHHWYFRYTLTDSEGKHEVYRCYNCESKKKERI